MILPKIQNFFYQLQYSASVYFFGFSAFKQHFYCGPKLRGKVIPLTALSFSSKYTSMNNPQSSFFTLECQLTQIQPSFRSLFFCPQQPLKMRPQVSVRLSEYGNGARSGFTEVHGGIGQCNIYDIYSVIFMIYM